MNPFVSFQQRPYLFAPVSSGVVPHHDEMTSQVLEQMTKEFADFNLLNVLVIKTVIKSESFSFWAYRNA